MKILTKRPFWRRVARALGSRLFNWAENNGDPRITNNGELWLLRELLARHVALAQRRPFVVFDAGANVGNYTRLILQEARRAGCAVEVHAFEPAPHNIELLRQKFAGEPAVRVVGAALAARAGEASLYAGKSGSSHASLVQRGILKGNVTDVVTVPLIRLADYVEMSGVAHIDLLKLDIEGAEMDALHGFDEKLHPSFVDVIQFEYGGTTLDAGVTLKALHRLLVLQGYRFAKLFPRAVEVRDYDEWMENYSFSNYLALSPQCIQSRGDILFR
ncbi:MAG: FkbM family methyltransferase [Verrucomicrobia bacterium]|nr:FkbM family methyltransferase [Verrucomicrobiota bacterium]